MADAPKKMVDITPKVLGERIAAAQKEKSVLEQKAKALLSEGKGDSPEYNALIEHHRQIRGHQRMLEGMNTKASEASKTAEAGTNLVEGAKALDELLKKNIADEEERRRNQ